jgi:hypothetical protein
MLFDCASYYFNSTTQQTVWEQPNAPFIKALPAGWEEFLTDDNRPYYFNATTNQTVWNRPV